MCTQLINEGFVIDLLGIPIYYNNFRKNFEFKKSLKNSFDEFEIRIFSSNYKKFTTQ